MFWTTYPVPNNNNNKKITQCARTQFISLKLVSMDRMIAHCPNYTIFINAIRHDLLISSPCLCGACGAIKEILWLVVFATPHLRLTNCVSGVIQLIPA